MSNKKKNNIFDVDQMAEAAQNVGVVLMAAAVTLGIATDHISDKKIVLPNQPAFALAGENSNDNALRRERDESAPHYVSYNNYQRTPARSGKH